MGQEDASDSSPSSAESSFRELDDVFLQTQTTIWLGEVLHTRLDEQLNISDLLADGELLFEVSKVIWKMLLTKCMELRHTKGYKYKPFASRKSSGRYLPYSNVDSFLKDLLLRKELITPYVHSGDQLGDILTKPLAHISFQQLSSKLGMFDLYAPT